VEAARRSPVPSRATDAPFLRFERLERFEQLERLQRLEQLEQPEPKGHPERIVLLVR
jgi:hypothetical protein